MKAIRKIEKIIVWALIVMLTLLLIISVLDIIYQIIISISKSENYIPDINMLTEFFGMFLVILIGIELLETIKAYLKEDVVHVEIVILVAIIAIARKVIVLDYYETNAMTLIGMGVLVITLAGAYYLIKQIDYRYPLKSKEKSKDN